MSDSEAPDLIVLADTIYSVDGSSPAPQAFAVKNGKFTYVGSANDARSLRSAKTKTLDFRGAGGTIMPGIVDAHLHLLMLGLSLGYADVRDAASFEETVERIVDFARASPDTWITGNGWNHESWPTKVFPTHDLLSAAIPDKAAVIYRIDRHALLANAKAMQLSGVSASTPEPVGGRIVRSADGTPTGVFIDNAIPLVAGKIPKPTHARLVRAVRDALKECNRWGVTAIAEPGGDVAAIAAEEEVLRSGDFSLRNHFMLTDRPELLDRYFALGPQIGLYEDRFSIRALKMYADGALGSCGAALLEPYDDDPANTGLMLSTQEHMYDVCRRAYDAGFQVCIHAIGDRGNRLVLEVFESALRASPRRDHRSRIEHAQVLALSDIPRFAQMGVIPSMQATHHVSDMAWAEAKLGSRRLRGAYAWRALLDAGSFIANGTDAPIESVNSLRTFHAAITREPPDLGMTREEALKSMTIWAANANFQDDRIGSITPGKYADFVVMDRDWMRVAPEEILQTHILATYSSGEPVYTS